MDRVLNGGDVLRGGSHQSKAEPAGRSGSVTKRLLDFERDKSTQLLDYCQQADKSCIRAMNEKLQTHLRFAVE